MNSYEFNKIAGWVLAAMISVLGISILTQGLFPTGSPKTAGYVVEGVEEEGAAGPAAADTEKPIAFYLASADVSRGETQFKKCAACHTITKGGAAGIGPNLWGINGAPHAHMAGFGYSPAMEATHDRTWDWDSLSHWIQSPKKYIPGNKMSFAGLGKAQDRADLIAYLNSQSDSPKPLPEVPAEDDSAASADDGDAAATASADDDSSDAGADDAAAPADAA